jgi:hypothetical protein
MTDLQKLARRLGNTLSRGGATVTDADVLELLAHGEQLADLTERCARIARTLLHAAQDGTETPHDVTISRIWRPCSGPSSSWRNFAAS